MRFFVSSLAVLACLGVASVALACKCKPPPPPKAALEASSAVFAGKVTAIEEAGDFQIAVTVEVAQSWKGIDGKKVTVYTARDGAACGYGFQKGTSYLVYAGEEKRGEKAAFSTGLCTRTRPLADAKEDLAALGEANQPK